MGRGGYSAGGGGDRMQNLESIVDQQRRHIIQLQDAVESRLQAVERFVEQETAATAKRLTQLEDFGYQQQAQMKDLPGLCLSHVALRDVHQVQSKELGELRREHLKFREEHEALRDCLVRSGVLQVPQLHTRLRIASGLCSLRDTLADRRILATLCQLLGERGAAVGHLTIASRAFTVPPRTLEGLLALAAPEVADAESPRTAFDLDEAAWSKIEDQDPSEWVLDKWATSLTVDEVFGRFGVSSVLGRGDLVRFTDVYSIFPLIGITMDQFVNKFSFLPAVRVARDTKTVEEMANAILRRFASGSVDAKGKNAILRRDVHRLLEIIGYNLKRFKSFFSNIDEDADDPPEKVTIGNYCIRRSVGESLKGVCCYSAEHTTSFKKVAVKWPAPKDEVLAFKAIVEKAPKHCIGLPLLYDSGSYKGQSYLVTELLGSPMNRVFASLATRPKKERWRAVCVIGRLMVRRLQALHSCGYVHCDISPENILLGPARGNDDPPGTVGLYLIDFEQAQKHPEGQMLDPEVGSAEWSSIRSAEAECERLPEDDLEALGWVLLTGLLGELPWFEWLSQAYRDWSSKWTKMQVIKQVRWAKIRLLDDGWKPPGWKKSTKVPKHLAGFIRTCRPGMLGTAPGSPDYAALDTLLGGDPDHTLEEAERADLSEFREILASLLCGDGTR
eukprot:gnl/TRDRNA2_/TRDRNA2_129063_c0_seq1.p1 gnl/TRDRNA2_/TRDRNA2_129063_c0~~gnl/TRDRNA2_/TRDRNA2_129063_c0_seq1.p1  ORF type:complete len:709 (+),score=97.04 gnl/TRDRNA2_/TRDRNA2_129063_c0_seq1:110-2128(+)